MPVIAYIKQLILRLKAHQLERAIRNCCDVAADHRAQALYYQGRLLPALSLQLDNARLKLGKPATALPSRPALGQIERRQPLIAERAA